MNDRAQASQSQYQPIILNQMETISNSNWIVSDILMFQLLQFQKLLNIQLIRNQDSIDSFVTLNKKQNGCKNGQSGTSTTSDGVDNINKDHNSYQTIINIKCKANVSAKEDKIRKKELIKSKNNTNQKEEQRIRDQDSSYNPNLEQNPKPRQPSQSESKNAPKNISKAILLFVVKKQKELNKLMQLLQIDRKQFMEQVAGLKGKIHAISELRSLWVDSENKHAKILRIISNYYLRKYSLQHIFNSRVTQYAKHLKYRKRILSVLRNPGMFTHMKEY